MKETKRAILLFCIASSIYSARLLGCSGTYYSLAILCSIIRSFESAMTPPLKYSDAY